MTENEQQDTDLKEDSQEGDEANAVSDDAEMDTNAGEGMADADLVDQLADAQDKAAQSAELALRTRAEMENLKRRSERDVENAHKFALEKFVQELLPVIDSLDMAIQAAQADGATVDSLREGTELTVKMFKQCIEKFGIQALHPVGQSFNPDHHQAMTMIEHPEHAANTVVDVMQKGYLLNERLIRPAMVVVSKGSGDDEGSEVAENDKESTT